MAQKFDESEANALKTKLNNEFNQVKHELENMTKTVEDVRSWWSGGSEEAFITHFKNTKKKVNKALTDCTEMYEKLVNEIVKAKQEQENSLKNSINKLG
jgi:uncharacterized protein YukE